MSLTRKRIDELKALVAKATPGPWWVQRKYDGGRTVCQMRHQSETVCINRAAHVEGDPWDAHLANANLIEALRNDADALLALAAEALELRERIKTATRFKFAAGVHWSDDIEICRCEGHLLPKQPHMWAVRQGGNVLGKTGDFVYEPLPSSRNDEFYAEYRFDTYEDAEAAAAKCSPRGLIQNARRGK